MERCLSRLRLDETNVVAGCSRNRVVIPENNSLVGKGCLEPTHSNTVLSVLSRFADIQRLTHIEIRDYDYYYLLIYSMLLSLVLVSYIRFTFIKAL